MNRKNKNNSATAHKNGTALNPANNGDPQTEIEYLKLADKSLQGIIILQDRKIIYANEAFVRIIEFSIDELLTFEEPEILDLIQEPDKELVWNNYKNRLAGLDVPSKYQIKLKSKSGTVKILEMFSQRVIYNGKPSVQAIFLDITQQVEALKALEESELRFRTIFEHSGVAMVITEIDGTMIRVNQSFAKMFGYSIEELQGLNPHALTYPGDLSETLKMINEFKNNRDVISRQIEKKYFNKEGEVFWGLVTITAIRNNEGKIVYLIGQLQDITKRKNAEKELKIYAEKLKNLNSSKDKFFSIISHDLRSPFNALLGISEYTSQFFDELSKDELKESINSIHSSSKTVYELIQKLLEWAQIQLGKLETEKSKIDLFELSENVIRLYKGFAERKKILLRNKIEQYTFVYADKYMIEAVMRNLISNAVKFTSAGGSIDIESKLNSDFAEVIVSDTGIGISSIDQGKLFQIDEQFHTEGTADEMGTGLGLILSKEFVELNDGKISFESKKNEGSKFMFTLPLPGDHRTKTK